MSRYGTCKHTFATQEQYVVGTRPGDKPQRVYDEHYTCTWLDQFDHERLPPPIKRMNGGFDIRPTDCDACPHYAPPDLSIPGAPLPGRT